MDTSLLFRWHCVIACQRSGTVAFCKRIRSLAVNKVVNSVVHISLIKDNKTGRHQSRDR